MKRKTREPCDTFDEMTLGSVGTRLMAGYLMRSPEAIPSPSAIGNYYRSRDIDTKERLADANLDCCVTLKAEKEEARAARRTTKGREEDDASGTGAGEVVADGEEVIVID